MENWKRNYEINENRRNKRKMLIFVCFVYFRLFRVSKSDRCLLFSFNHFSIQHSDIAICQVKESAIVRDQTDGGTVRVQLLEKIHHHLAACRIEVAGRFI